MQQKPPRWNISPALIAPNARGLWRGVAFVTPLWGHSGKGAFLGAGGKPINIAPTENGPLWRGTPYGIGLGRVAGTSNKKILNLTQNAIVTSDGAGTGDFTMAILADLKSGTGATYLAMGQGHPSTGGLPRAYINCNADSGEIYSSGAIVFATKDSVATLLFVPGMIDNNFHLFVCSRAGSTLRLYRDGILVGSTTNTVRDVTASGHEFVLGGAFNSTTAGIPDTTTIAFSAGWNRALNDAEVRMLSRDPFCMFRPSAEWRGVWTPVGGGGASIVPVLMRQYRSRWAA